MPAGWEPAAAGYRAVFWLAHSSVFTTSPVTHTCVALDKQSDAEIERALDAFVARAARHLPTLLVSMDLGPGSESDFERLIERMLNSLEAHNRARVTRQKDGFRWQAHLIANLPSYLCGCMPNSWKGMLEGIPAFVCGAGPSLDASGESLARIADKGVVFAADSSLRALAKLGVRADFCVSVDVAKHPGKCLPADVPSPGKVVLSAVSPPEWNEVGGGIARYYLSSNQLSLDWLASLGFGRTPVNVCENCGATAIELARFLGCRPIVLFGMDLALSGEGTYARHHGETDQALYKDSGYNAALKHPKVPGNYHDWVRTHVIGDWRALDRRLATWPEGLVHVVTDRGARLSNTTVHQAGSFTLGGKPGVAAPALAALAGPSQAGTRVTEAVGASLLEHGRKIVSRKKILLAHLEAGRVQEVVAELRPLFTEGEGGRIMGSYSLRLMPHLLPPIDPDVGFWRDALRELEELAFSMISIGSRLGGNAER